MLYLVAALGGIAGLAWELLWMHYTALSIGVSSQAAALTLIAFSLGMAFGARVAGRWLEKRPETNLFRFWALLEVLIGICGQALEPGFDLVARVDTSVWQASPAAAPLVHLVGMLLLLAVPAAFMGATIPVFREVGERTSVSVGRLYAANVGGAALGIVLASFVFIPALGVSITVSIASAIDLIIGGLLFTYSPRKLAGAGDPKADADTDSSQSIAPLSARTAALVVAVTGFTTFALEVAWFRSLRAALQATTDSFALVLFGVLLPLSLGGAVAPSLARRGKFSLGLVLALAGLCVLITTPVIERFDVVMVGLSGTSTFTLDVIRRLLLILAVLGPTMFLIGIGLPWVLEATPDANAAGRVYAINTVGAALGSLLAAWLLLPTLGFAKTAWLSGALLLAAAWAVDTERRKVAIGMAVVGLAVAIGGASDVGKLRVQTNLEDEHSVVASKEGPDATVSVIEHTDGSRHLVIDGFYASTNHSGSHYMPWMGHLPMLMHPDPKQALVICFGTGQTANAVRKEGPEHLDIVDINETVLSFNTLFPENESVLEDPRVEAHVMDGRSWMRRVGKSYDVITLEPMPPTFAGSNALYSAEFYGLVHDKLTEHGVVAQWLPFHLVSPEESASIVAAFMAHFPDSYLWIDTLGTGILVGQKTPGPLFPGIGRDVQRDLSPQEVMSRLRFGPDVLSQYVELGEVVTDDNQHLSYGWGRMRWWGQGAEEYDTLRYQLALLEAVAAPGPIEVKAVEFLSKYPHPGTL